MSRSNVIRAAAVAAALTAGVVGAPPAEADAAPRPTADSWTVPGAGAQASGATTYVGGDFPWDRTYELNGTLRAPASGCVSVWSQFVVVLPNLPYEKRATACSGATSTVHEAGTIGSPTQGHSVRLKVCAGTSQELCGEPVIVAR